MRVGEEGIRSLVAVLLVVFIVIMGVYLWTIDIIAYQKQFAMILAAELVAFSLLMYVRWEPSWVEVKKNWLLVGCASLGVTLVLAAL